MAAGLGLRIYGFCCNVVFCLVSGWHQTKYSKHLVLSVSVYRFRSGLCAEISKPRFSAFVFTALRRQRYFWHNPFLFSFCCAYASWLFWIAFWVAFFDGKLITNCAQYPPQRRPDAKKDNTRHWKPWKANLSTRWEQYCLWYGAKVSGWAFNLRHTT